MNILFDAGYVLVEGNPVQVPVNVLNKEESIASLNQQTDNLRISKAGDPYADLWFRLDSIPL
jgi:hypothetical protein